MSEIQISKNEILAQRYFLRNIEQEVFLDAIELYANLATEASNLKLKKEKCRGFKETTRAYKRTISNW